jgi:hypothetical protein
VPTAIIIIIVIACTERTSECRTQYALLNLRGCFVGDGGGKLILFMKFSRDGNFKFLGQSRH